jgi:hypothetical protein
LRQANAEVVTRAMTDTSTKLEVYFPNMAKWFSIVTAEELSKLRRAIMQQADQRIRRILWTILAETIRLTSNDRTSTYKLHARPMDELKTRVVSPLEIYQVLAQQSINDILTFKRELSELRFIEEDKYRGDIFIDLRDSTKSLIAPYQKEKKEFDLLVTSPPYGDNATTITYGQNAYLPLQWIDLSDIGSGSLASFLRTTQEIDRRSLGGKTPKQLDEMKAKIEIESFQLKTVLSNLANKPRDRVARVVSFYNDFIESIDKMIPSLASNSYMIWTLGNRRVGGIEIPNDKILEEILGRRGVILVTDVDRIIHFKRMPQKNQTAQTMRTEKILIFRKLPMGIISNE